MARDTKGHWVINSRWEVRFVSNTALSNKANRRIAAGNCFKSKKEAQAFLITMRELKAGKLQIVAVRPWWDFWRKRSWAR